jgi:uncharacterized protein (TIGR00266 family)
MFTRKCYLNRCPSNLASELSTQEAGISNINPYIQNFFKQAHNLPIAHKKPDSGKRKMKFEIKYKPSYAMLVANLEQGEMITAESGAMTYMTPNIEVHTRKREKSLWGSLGLSIIGGQSFWVNDFVAQNGAGEAAFVAAPVGDIKQLDIAPGSGYIIQKSAYIASTQGIDLDVKWEGFTKGLFGQGLFMIRATGSGQMFINTFGAIDTHTLQPGQTLVVDNFHLVGFSESCSYKVTRVGGIKETLLSGEGLVTQITGPGEVHIQTKNLQEFTEWLWTLLEPKVRAVRSR